MPAPTTKFLAGCALLAICMTPPAGADERLAQTIARIKPAIVGIGTYAEVRRPPAAFLGTGFVIGDGRHVATNHHVIEVELDAAHQEHLVAFIGHGREVQYRTARITAIDQQHDLAVLTIDGAALPALAIDATAEIREGTSIAFTGFPLGAVLGLHPVTHQGIVSALTPLAIPASTAAQLSTDKIAALRAPYNVIQLDATAYPSNSGSPVYDQSTGKVIGIVNQVFVKGKKEDVLRDPSALTYAIPAVYLQTLLDRQ